MSDVRNNLIPTNIQELFLPLSRIHAFIRHYIGRLHLQTFISKKSNLEVQKNCFSRFGVKLCNEIPTKLRTLSKHKFKFNIRASLLDILETGDTYYEIDEITLKMKNAEPIFCNPAYKNSELMFCFLS